jgi:hypothetical protein
MVSAGDSAFSAINLLLPPRRPLSPAGTLLYNICALPLYRTGRCLAPASPY